MQCSIAIRFGLRYVVAESRDRPVLSQTACDLVRARLIGHYGSYAADVTHSRQLHPWLSPKLVGDRWNPLQTLRDNGLPCLGHVVTKVGCHLREGLGVLAAPPFDDFERLYDLRPTLSDRSFTFCGQTDLLGEESAGT